MDVTATPPPNVNVPAKFAREISSTVWPRSRTPKAPGMRAPRDGGVVLELVAVLRIVGASDRRAAAVERCQDLDGGSGVVGDAEAVDAEELEPRFVDDSRAENRGLRDLRGVADVPRMVAARDQVEAPDAGVAHVGAQELVTPREGVVGAQLIIQARADGDAALRNAKDVRERIDDGERLRIERGPVDDGAVVDRIAADIQEERALRVNWAAQAAAVFLQEERRLPGGIGVARVPEIIGEVVVAQSFEFVRARLGEDLDAAEAEFVVLGRKRVLVDANLADGFLGRKLASAEAVDVNGAAVGTRGRAGQGLQIGGEVVGVIGERFEVGPAQRQGAGIAGRVGAYGRSGPVLHGHVLRGRRHLSTRGGASDRPASARS